MIKSTVTLGLQKGEENKKKKKKLYSYNIRTPTVGGIKKLIISSCATFVYPIVFCICKYFNLDYLHISDEFSLLLPLILI